MSRGASQHIRQIHQQQQNAIQKQKQQQGWAQQHAWHAWGQQPETHSRSHHQRQPLPSCPPFTSPLISPTVDSLFLVLPKQTERFECRNRLAARTGSQTEQRCSPAAPQQVQSDMPQRESSQKSGEKIWLGFWLCWVEFVLWCWTPSTKPLSTILFRMAPVQIQTSSESPGATLPFPLRLRLKEKSFPTTIGYLAVDCPIEKIKICTNFLNFVFIQMQICRNSRTYV